MYLKLVKSLLFFCYIVSTLKSQARGHVIREAKASELERLEKPIFNYHRNGINIDMRIVPAFNKTVPLDDGFPKFPFGEVGRCLFDLSLTCVNKRIVRFLNVVGDLQEITLFGQTVKLVKLKELPTERLDERKMISDNDIDKSIDDFFNTFALRITFPEWKKNKNQIDIMMENKDSIEGRGKSGGGSKGGGKGGKGGKGGGCKKMMLMMAMGLKMKLVGILGIAAMKGLLLSGISLIMSKLMLLQQFMSKKGGLFGGFSGGTSNNFGNQGSLKEIVLLTKAGGSSGNAGGGCNGAGCGGSPVLDSYGAPPTNGGGGGGSYDYSGAVSSSGSGWGRSFEQHPISYSNKEYDQEMPLIVTKEDEITALKSNINTEFNQTSLKNFTSDHILKRLEPS